jgi:hypothetical protein
LNGNSHVQVRARPDCKTIPALQKMLAQIEHYRPKLFAGPLIVSTPQGHYLLQPQKNQQSAGTVLSRIITEKEFPFPEGRGPNSILSKDCHGAADLQIYITLSPALGYLFWPNVVNER